MTTSRSLRRLVRVILVLCGVGCAHGADLGADYTWRPLKIGGGGWVTGMDLHPVNADVRYVRTDVSGAYRWDGATSSWKQIVTAQSVPADTVAYGKYCGVDSLVGAPSAADVAYMAFAGKPYGVAEGQIYKSVNRGGTWTPTGFAANQVKMVANGEGRGEGVRLGVVRVIREVVL